MPADLGLEAVHRMAKLWLIDDDRVKWDEDGFEWWPGRFRVSVRAQRHPDEKDGRKWRLSVRTEFLREIACGDEKVGEAIFPMAGLAPTYAWVYPPAALLGLADQPRVAISAETLKPLVGSTIAFQSTAYMREESAAYLPEFFGGLAILQVVDAELLAEDTAGLLNARPDASRLSENAPQHPDGMLDVTRDVYLPAGRDPSRWEGTREFAEAAELYGKNNLYFAGSDAREFAVETPVGPETAMIRLNNDIPHPVLGSGLLATLQMPHKTNKVEATQQCFWLNFLESGYWSDIPQLGSWYPLDLGDGTFQACHAFFIPNCMYRPNVAMNAAIWQVARAQWVKDTLWPDLKNVSMTEILLQRFLESEEFRDLKETIQPAKRSGLFGWLKRSKQPD
jgi:hypothetical protein